MERFKPAIGTAGISRALMLVFVISLSMLSNHVFAQTGNQVVRIANLRIDSVQLDKYKALLREEIETSIRVEPGVLTLYALEEKNRQGHITIFEVYANETAYKSHLETSHFKKYKSATKDMVKSLELVETNPIILGAKARK